MKPILGQERSNGKPRARGARDCPTTPAQLNSLLALLAQRHIHAIMFPTGICARAFPGMVPTMLAGMPSRAK